MKGKLLPFFLAAAMVLGLLSGIGLNARAEDGATEKVVNLRCLSDGTEVSGITKFKNALTGDEGYVNGKYGADAAYLGEEDGKVKFMISGVVGLAEKEKVQVCDIEGCKFSSYEVADDGRLLHNISQNINGSDTHPRMVGFAPSYLNGGGTAYYSYDGHYFYEDYSVMLQDYRGETRAGSVNPDTPYYNYYQYLPMRTKTVYTGDELTGILNSKVEENSKLKGLGCCFTENQDKYGINALLMAGIAANESAWGMSNIALTKNNLFGLNAIDSDPDDANAFASTEQCVEEFAKEWMSKGYADPEDMRYNGLFLGDKAGGINVKYASDPYWGEKAANIAWKLDVENDVGRQDRYTYTIGVKDTVNNSGVTGLNVRKESNTDSPVVYNTGRRPHFPFAILGEENGFYKVQSDPPLSEDRSKIANVEKEGGSGEYDFEAMYLYASKDYITLVNGEAPAKPQEPEKLKGDVNLNGKVDIIDARWLLQASSGNRILTDEQKAVADVNNDTKVNIIDARWLLQVSSGNRIL